MSYTLYINTPEAISEIPLPAVNNKRIKLDISDICPGCALEAEVYDGAWKLLSSDTLTVVSDSADIYGGAVINLSAESGVCFAVMVKENEAEKNIYKKYSAAGKGAVTVGRAKDNDICFCDDFVGSHHCTISLDGGYTLTDNSKNGTYVNGKRVSGSTALEMCDEIFITGHKLILLGSVIAVCETDCAAVSLPEADLAALKNEQVYADNSFFSRAPRRIEPLDSETVEIDDPPAKQKMRSQPLIFIIGPSVTMPIPILVSVLVNIASNAGAARSGMMYLGTAVSVVLSALIGTFWALAHQIYNKKQLASDEKERTEAYNKYIENNRQLLEDKHIKNRDILKKSYLSTAELTKAVQCGSGALWNRNIYQNDFLTIRIGTGKVKLPADIVVSKQKFSMNDDELCRLPHELHDKYEMIEDCVSALSLIHHKVIGMVGDKDVLPLIVNNIVCQTAALHCYTDVKVGFIADSADSMLYSWAKWLPHTFLGGSDARLVSFDSSSREKVIYEVASELRRRYEESEGGGEKRMLLPHIVLFCTSAELLRGSILQKYMSSPEYLGITFILAYGSLDMLPNECKAIIEYTENFSGFYLLDEEISEENMTSFELTDIAAAEKFARSISGYYVGETVRGGVPSSVDYFEMLGIGRIEQWDLLRKYKTNRSYEGLKSFIGLGQGGAPVYLDIHDKKDGPHGLVAGTTGSGKSETLQSFILSLVMNYSPDEVAFVLIDYKGGGMANAFEGLPHIAGMITNLSDENGGELDRGLTRRACSSLRSEIKRRQTVFGRYKINHIDTYTRLYDEQKADVPLPHLIIISDEFAELKKEQPEFIKELISVARVGRSLGIHLILATQKPSGVVDDEIWSNSRFRICLRVQDKQDSTGMLKRPDAAYITEAGRAFLQIGNDEIFEEFQSGYSGGEYIPKEKVVSAEDSEAVMIEIDGSPAVIHNKRRTESCTRTELGEAVKYISDCCKRFGAAPAAPLWLPPLSRNILLDDIDIPACEGQICCVYGMIDNYEQQKQYPCTIDLMSCSNLKICGTAGSGKTTLLQTMICSAVKRYTPEEFTFYIIDLSSRTFKLFKRLPHCGGVVYDEDKGSVERLIKLLTDMVKERRTMFEAEDIGSYKEYIKLHKLPLTVLAIDNFGAFTELFSEYEDIMLKLIQEGVRYGIQIIVTVSNTSEIKYKMRSYILDSISLRMAEKGEYTELIGRTPEYMLPAVSGRGFVYSAGAVLEYQTALPICGRNESERSENMKKLFADIAQNYVGDGVKKLPVFSDNIKYRDMLTECNEDSLLIGYDHDKIEPFYIPFTSFFCYCVSGGTAEIDMFMGNIAEYAAVKNTDVKAVRLSSDMHFELDDSCTQYTDLSGINELIKYLHGEFSTRNRAVPEWKNDSRGLTMDKYLSKKFGRVFVIIDDMVKFCEVLYGSPDGKNGADLMDMFFRQGKNHGIHFFGGYNTARNTYLAASNTFRAENHGIHIGGKAEDQSVLDIALPLPKKFERLESNIGYSVEGNTITKVYIPERK